MKPKTFIRNCLKDAQTRLRKSETGIVIFAGDVTPVLQPAVCEEKGMRYVCTPSHADLAPPWECDVVPQLY